MARYLKPRIVFREPEEAPRVQLCREWPGERATIYRLGGNGPYAGMVEQRQPVRDEKHGFSISIMGYDREGGMQGAPPQETLPESRAFYHVARMLYLRLAGAMFPGMFSEPDELRFFNHEGAPHAAMYSPFVPDGNGMMAWCEAAKERFYAETGADRQTDIREQVLQEAHRRNPGLASLMERTTNAGLFVTSPETGHHVTPDGRTVFFEVGSLNVERALATAREGGNEEAIRWLALLAAVKMKFHAHDVMRKERGPHPQIVAVFRVTETMAREGLDAALEQIERMRGMDDADGGEPDSDAFRAATSFAETGISLLFGIARELLDMRITCADGSVMDGEAVLWRADVVTSALAGYYEWATREARERKPVLIAPADIDERVFWPYPV